MKSIKNTKKEVSIKNTKNEEHKENSIRLLCRNVMLESAKVITKASLLSKLLQTTQQ